MVGFGGVIGGLCAMGQIPVALRATGQGRGLTGWIHGSFYISMDPCASSAGVERVFSAAGKMHGDLSKSAKDTTLERSLFAAFNTD